MKKPARNYLKSKSVAKHQTRKPAKLKYSKQPTLIIISGPAGCGRTSLSLNGANALCKHGQSVVFFDIHCGLTHSILKGCGLDLYNGSNFIAYSGNSGEAILDCAKKNMTVAKVIIIDGLSDVAPDSLFNKSIEDCSWSEFHSVQNRLIKTLKTEAEKHGVTIIATINRKLQFNSGNGVYYPADWFAELADMYIEISKGKDIGAYHTEESGQYRLTINPEGPNPVIDSNSIVGWEAMFAVYQKNDIPKQYHTNFTYHKFLYGIGFDLDFSQRRVKNLLLADAPKHNNKGV